MRGNHTKRVFLCLLIISAIGILRSIPGISIDDHTPVYEQTIDDASLVNAPEGFSLPVYTGEPAVVLNDNLPFTPFPGTDTCYEDYSGLDGLGRCGIAEALLGPDTLPSEERGQIGSVKPSGWHTVKYNDLIDGNYLYNRCHLIAFSLSGENANPENLITGTRYLNVAGMLPYEMQVLDYIRDTDDKVFYRASPIFSGTELVTRGVLLEARAFDQSFSFCVFLHNVQPGIEIDYATGESKRFDR